MIDFCPYIGCARYALICSDMLQDGNINESDSSVTVNGEGLQGVTEPSRARCIFLALSPFTGAPLLRLDGYIFHDATELGVRTSFATCPCLPQPSAVQRRLVKLPENTLASRHNSLYFKSRSPLPTKLAIVLYWPSFVYIPSFMLDFQGDSTLAS